MILIRVVHPQEMEKYADLAVFSEKKFEELEVAKIVMAVFRHQLDKYFSKHLLRSC